MLRSLLSNPLLLREMFSGVRFSAPGRATYPGLTVTGLVCAVSFGLFWLMGKPNNAFSCSNWFVLAALAQTWIWLYRSGSYAASAIAGSDEDGALAVIVTTPQTLEQALLAKMAGVLAPLGVEVLLTSILNYLVFFCFGIAPQILFFGVTCFQMALIAGGAGVGLLFGRRLGDPKLATRTYRKLVTFIGVAGFIMMFSNRGGHVAMVSIALYLLLSLLPALFEKFRLWTGTVALALIILMPFSFMFDLHGIYEKAKLANPYVALCYTAPVDLTNVNEVYHLPESVLYPFANDFYCRCTGAQKLAYSPTWINRFLMLIEYNYKVADVVNGEYLRWRISKLSVFAWGGVLLFILSVLGVECSIKRRIGNY